MDQVISLRTNPFPGLRPFRENETHLFFGRENQVDAMVDKLAATNFLAVIGTSGSGKSSLVNCGLRPALRQGLMSRAGTAWRMAQFRPGNDPIGSMARALAQDGVLFGARTTTALSLADIVETTLRMSRLGLIDICEQAALDDGVNLLVVVDQFEELFRYRQVSGARTFAEDAAAFVNLLLEVKAHLPSRLFVVLTMRSDFLGDCTQFPGLAEAINGGQYLVPRMTRDERRDAIERPAGVGGARIAPVLLTRLVNDVGDNPDQLSILQHALNRTWTLWEQGGSKGPLDLSHYEAIGTMEHALDRHADQAYAELTERQKQIAEKLFKALTDKATDSRGVRRPTTMATLSALADATIDEVTSVIDVFRDPSRSFLMPPAGEPLRPESVIDISHESLMRVWQRLSKWADEEALSARGYRRLAETAELHAAGDASLWRDPELQLALDWRDKNQPNETWACRYHPGFAAAMAFLTASSDALAAERAERQRQLERERQAERDKVATQARYTRWMLWATVCCAVVTVAAVILFLDASAARRTADDNLKKANEASRIADENARVAEEKKNEIQLYLREAQITESRSLVSRAAQDPNDYSGKILLSLEALPDANENMTRPLDLLAQESLVDGLDDMRELAVFGGFGRAVTNLAVTADAGRILIGSADRTGPSVRLFNAATKTELFRIRGHTGTVTSLAITPDGRRIVTASTDRTARVWDGNSGAELAVLKGHGSAVNGVAISADGKRVVTGSTDRTARVWDAATGAELLQFKGHGGPIASVAMTPDGSVVVTGSRDRMARVWQAETGTEIGRTKSHSGAVTDVALSANGQRIVTSSDDGVHLWDTASGLELAQLKGHTKAVTSLAMTPDGSRIVTGSADKTARVWETNGGELIQLKGHSGQVDGVAVTPDGNRVITGSEDGTVRVWDASGREKVQLRSEAKATSPASTPEAVSPAGDAQDDVVRPGDSAVAERKGRVDEVRGVAMSGDGTRVVVASGDGTVRLWDAAMGAMLRQFKGHEGAVNGVAITPDAARVVTGSDDNTVRLWDASSGAELLRLGHENAVASVALTPDALLIVTGAKDGTTMLWSATTREPLQKFIGHEDAVNGVAISADGKRIVTASSDQTVRLWDAANGSELHRFEGHEGPVLSVAWTSDGKRLVTGSADGTARLWDAATGEMLVELKRPKGAIVSVAVTGNGRHVVTGGDDGAARLWDTMSGTEVRQLKAYGGPVNSVAISGDGALVVTGTADAVTRLWESAKLRLPKVQYRISTPFIRQILLDHAKELVPRCLSIQQRRVFALGPTPPNWCIDMGKYPYNTELWRSWRAGHVDIAKDSDEAQTIAEFYGDYADGLLKAGDYRKALAVADLGIAFAPDMLWLFINKAHALMFLDRTEEAKAEYRAHLGQEAMSGKSWETAILEDFRALRAAGRCHPLMKEIEAELTNSDPEALECELR